MIRFDTNGQIEHLRQYEWISEILSSRRMSVYPRSIVMNGKIICNRSQTANNVTTETFECTMYRWQCLRESTVPLSVHSPQMRRVHK